MTIFDYHFESEEVIYCSERFPFASSELVQNLKLLALKNKRERIRLCMHENIHSNLHEMLIIHSKNCYIRPHSHLQNDESITILEGNADLILFSEAGDIQSTIRLTEYGEDGCFYFKIKKNIFHMLIIRSDFLVFKEVSEGPFISENMRYAKWSPDESTNAYLAYIDMIKKQIN